jgi:hypothetical protein
MSGGQETRAAETGLLKMHNSRVMVEGTILVFWTEQQEAEMGIRRKKMRMKTRVMMAIKQQKAAKDGQTRARQECSSYRSTPRS